MLKQFLKLALLISPVACFAGSPSVLLQGLFNTDDQIEFFSFTNDGISTTTIESYGYAGGVANSTTIAEGGFAPDATIFDQLGNFVVSDNGGHCDETATDSVSGLCDDPFLQISTAGTYTLALTVYDNLAINSLSDGFKQTGNPGFTCAENGGTGDFCDVTDGLFTPRTGAWAISIEGATQVADITSNTPEPGTLPMALAGSVFVVTLPRRRRRKSS